MYQGFSRLVLALLLLVVTMRAAQAQPALPNGAPPPEVVFDGPDVNYESQAWIVMNMMEAATAPPMRGGAERHHESRLRHILALHWLRGKK